MKSVFNPADAAELVNRITKLTPESKPDWGKMSVSQMLAHCNVAYELSLEDKHPKPNALVKLLLKLFVKGKVTGTQPYPRNGRTAPQFLVKDDKDFNTEKSRLINYINKTVALGAPHFEGKESHSFGKLSAREWNNMFYRHLDHHLTQFGV